MEAIFLGRMTIDDGVLYHIRRVEDCPVSALFLALPGIVRLRSGACELVLVYTEEHMRACMRLYMVQYPGLRCGCR